MPAASDDSQLTTEQEIQRVHARVYGHVQRVGFRLFVRQAAQRLELAGWVRNRRGGCVEVMAQGRRPALDSLLVDLQAGPEGARVSHVEHDWLPTARHLVGFRVRWIGFL